MKKYLNSINRLEKSVKWFLITELFYGIAYAIWNLDYNLDLNAKGFSDINIVSVTSLGLIITAFLSLLAGRLCDKVGYHPMMVIGCFFRAVGIILTALIPGHSMIYFSQILFSIGTACILSSEFPFILSLTSETTSNLVYTLLLSVANIGMFAGYMLGGMVPGLTHNHFFKYTPVILISGIFFFMIGIGRYFLPKRSINSRDNVMGIRFFSEPKVIWFSIYGMLGSTVIFLVSSMMNIIFKKEFNLTDMNIGIAYSLIAVISSISFFTVPLVISKWNKSRISIITLLFSSLVLLLMSFSSIIFFIILWISFYFLNSVLTGTVDSAMLQAIPENQRGTFSGIKVLANNLGYGGGTLLSGIILSYSKYYYIMVLGAIITLLQLFTYLWKCQKYIKTESIKS